MSSYNQVHRPQQEKKELRTIQEKAYAGQWVHSSVYRRLEQEKKELSSKLQETEKNRNELEQKNEKLRLELQQTKITFKSYKERMGKMTDLKMGSSEMLFEDLNNPCRESELNYKYDQLRNTIWPVVVNTLKKQKKDDDQHVKENAKLEIKRAFKKAEEDTHIVLKHIKNLFQLKEEDVTNKTKIFQYLDLAVHNLQMALYHKNMQLQIMGNSDDLNGLVKDFYNIRCLLALHNPPICLDWENCGKEDFPPIKHEEKTEYRMMFDLDEKQVDLGEVEQLLEKILNALDQKKNEDELRILLEELKHQVSELLLQITTLQKDKEKLQGESKNVEELNSAIKKNEAEWNQLRQKQDEKIKNEIQQAVTNYKESLSKQINEIYNHQPTEIHVEKSKQGTKQQKTLTL